MFFFYAVRQHGHSLMQEEQRRIVSLLRLRMH